MNCPKCNKNMVEGLVPSNTMKLQFIPKSGKMPKTIFGLGKNAVQLSKMPLFFSAKAVAYFCSECHFVIVPEYNDAAKNKQTIDGGDMDTE